MTTSSPFTTTTTTTTRTVEEDRVDPVVLTKHTEVTAGTSQLTKDTTQSATPTLTTKNTNLAANFIQPGGPFPPFAQTVSTPGTVAPGVAVAGSTAGSSPVPAPAPAGAAAAPVVIAPGSSPILGFVAPANPMQEVDVTTPSTTSSQETDTTQALSATITDETDTTASTLTTKITTVVTTVTTSPAPTNQYEHAAWRLDPGGQATILSFLPAGMTAIYLAIYRVTNDDDSGPVQVLTDGGRIDLAHGTSVDISSQTIAIVDGGNGSHGSYQNLCCAAQPLKVSDPKTDKSASAGDGTKKSGGGNGGNGDGVETGDGGGDDDPGGIPVTVGDGDEEAPVDDAENGIPVAVGD